MWPPLLTATNGAFNPASYRGAPPLVKRAPEHPLDVGPALDNMTSFKATQNDPSPPHETI